MEMATTGSNANSSTTPELLELVLEELELVLPVGSESSPPQAINKPDMIIAIDSLTKVDMTHPLTKWLLFSALGAFHIS